MECENIQSMIDDQAAMIFLRYSSFPLLMSALVSVLRVAKTFLRSPPRVFLIFLFNYFSGFLLGLRLGKISALRRRQLGSYLTKYCWLSQASTKPTERLPPKAVLKPNRTRFFSSHLNLLEMRPLSSAWDTLGLPSWKTSSTSSLLASSLFTRSFLVRMVTVMNQWLNQYSNINPILSAFLPYNLMLHSKPVTVILDIGSYRTLAGVAGQENPRLATYSYLTADTSLKTQDSFAKFSVAENQSIQGLEKTDDQIQSIFSRCNSFGQVDSYSFNKENFETFVQMVLAKNLEFSGETLSVLIAEDISAQPHQIDKQREEIAQFFFETLQIDSLTFMKKPMLSCFSVGRASGLVIDSGHSFTRASIVEDGYTVHSNSIGFGGGTIHGQISELLDEKCPNWKLSADIPEENFSESLSIFYKMLELEKIKHKFDTSQGMDEDQMVPEDNQIQYMLPDGNNVNLSRSEIVDPFTQYSNFYLKYLDFKEKEDTHQKLEYPDFITPSSLAGNISYRSPAHMAISVLDEFIARQEALSKTVVGHGAQKNHGLNLKQIKSEYLQSVVFTGGNFLFSQFATWTKEKLLKLSEQKIRTLISPVYNKNQNANSTSWVGGSIIGELSAFNHFWVTRKEWNQEKSSVLQEIPKGADAFHGQRKRNLAGLGLINKKCA